MLADFVYSIWITFLNGARSMFPLATNGIGGSTNQLNFFGIPGLGENLVRFFEDLGYYMDTSVWLSLFLLLLLIFTGFAQWKIVLYLYNLIPVVR